MIDIEDIVRTELERLYPEPKREPEWESVLERAKLQIRPESGPRMRRRWRLALGLGVPVVLIAGIALALLLASPWKSGPSVITSPSKSGPTVISVADVAMILKKTQAALAYRPGSVEHIRAQTTYTLIPLKKGTASLTESVSGEWWIETAPPFQHRSLQSYRSQTLETGGSRRCHARYVYFDPASHVLYRDNRFDAAPCTGSPLPPDPAAAIRELLGAGALKLSGKTQIAGRSVYRFEMPQRYYDKRLHAYMTLTGTGTLYVDAGDYRMVRFEWDSQTPESSSYGSYHAVVNYPTWEYLPPTMTNLRLADIRKQHPAARTSTLDKMPNDTTRRLFGAIGSCGVPPIPAVGLCGAPSMAPTK